MTALARLGGASRRAALPPARELPASSRLAPPGRHARRSPTSTSPFFPRPFACSAAAARTTATTPDDAQGDVASRPLFAATAETPTTPPTPTPTPTQPLSAPSLAPTTPNPLAPAVVYDAIVDDPGLIVLPVTVKTWLRAVLSGCYIAFGGLVAVAVVGSSPALVAWAPGLARLIFALVFPVGLLLNLSHGGELFTGNTFRGAAAVLGGKATISQLAKNWAVVFCGNFLGCLAILTVVLASGLFPSGSPAAAFAQSLADAKMALPLGETFFRAVLANWLVVLAVWQASSARTATDRFFAVWPPISAFVAAGLEHSVANMLLVPLGMAVGAEGLSAASFARFLTTNLAPVTLGNVVAGAVIVAGASHVAYGRRRTAGV